MAFADLRDWIALLEREGELVTIDAEVDPYLETTEIVDRTVKAGGPALLFRNAKGASHPLLINQFGTERRMCLAFGEPSLDAVARELEDVLEMQPPSGLVEKVKGLGQAQAHRRLGAEGRPLAAPARSSCIEPDLDLLPIQHCWPGDPAPFITLPAVITKDPRTGGRNVGMYRMQKIDARTTFMHWQIHKDGASDWRGMGDRLDVAVALGLDPVTAYSASAPLAEAHRRAHARRLPARGARRAREGEDGRPRGSGAGRDRARGLRREGRARHRGPVRRPHGLLLASGALPRSSISPA